MRNMQSQFTHQRSTFLGLAYCQKSLNHIFADFNVLNWLSIRFGTTASHNKTHTG